MGRLALVFLFGGGGSVLRYLVSGWVQRLGNGSFPMGTLAVNLVGCTAIGFLAPLMLGPLLKHDEWRVAILIGLLGGFTTFSSFAWETVTLTNGGQFLMALLNVLLSNCLGLAAAWLAARIVLIVYGT